MSACNSKIGATLVFSSTLISTSFIVLILVVLLINSWDAVSTLGLGLFTVQWEPAAGRFGILSMLYGSLMVTAIALLIAVPLGLSCAVYISEILEDKLRFYFKSLMEILSGIPSIIYGLIGIAYFSIWIGNLFELQSGRTILTAGMLLAIMVLPTIITLSDDALHNVPLKYREAAKGLGLYRYEVIISVVIPLAKSGITGAVLLALGRSLGETMAVMLVIGSIDKIPQPIFNILVPGQTITSKLGREIEEAAFASLHFSSLIFMSLLMLIIVLGLTVLAQQFFTTEQQLYE